MASQPDRTAAAKAIGQTSERNAATAIPASPSVQHEEENTEGAPLRHAPSVAPPKPRLH